MAREEEMSVIWVTPETSEAELREESTSHSESNTTDRAPNAVKIAQLRSRVEQQSSLIAMLKQRNDETFRELRQCKDSSEKEIVQRQELHGRLAEVTRAKSTLEQRFHTLSSNHEELIRIMEEYKSENKKLREESAKLGATNDAKFSTSLQEKEEQLLTLRDVVRQGEEKLRVMEDRCSLLKEEMEEMERNKQRKKMEYSEELERKQSQQRDIEQRLAKTEKKVKDVEINYLQLQKRNEELEMLLSQRDGTIEAKSSEIDGLQIELRSLKNEKEMLSQDLDHLSMELAENVQVKRLREQLKEEQMKVERLQKEFLAYQKHSSNLLTKERELNSKLRHMSDL